MLKRSPAGQKSLFTKFNIIIICITTICLAIGSFLMVRYTVQPSIEKDQLLNHECFNALSNAVKDKYSLIYNQGNLMLSNNHAAARIAAAKWNNELIMSYDDSRFITNYIDSVFFSDPDIDDMVIVSTDNRYVFAKSNKRDHILAARYNYTSLPPIQALLNSEKNIIVFRDMEQAYASERSQGVITFAVKLLNPINISSKEPTAIALINYPTTVFDDSYKQYNFSDILDLYVVNDSNQVIYSNNPSSCGQEFIIPDGNEAEVFSNSIGINGIKTYGSVSKHSIQAATMKLIGTMLKILVPCVLIMLLSALLLNRRYQKRVQHLADSMESVTTKGLGTRIPVRHNDELGALSEHFNKMCDSLDNYIDLHYRSELARQTAELNALQAQINPHFLYNTIESIRMRALEDGAPQIAEMLAQMGTLFRWMIQMEKQIVYIEDEVDYIESYLSLQSYRYNYSFEYECNIPNSILYLGIPKFTLQPIVENALLHGLKENGLEGCIIINAKTEGDNLILSVTDDGKGMNAETLDKLRNHISKGSPANDEFGIGVQNVNSRIALLFGDNYGVNINSTPNHGTEVTITIPAMLKKEMDNYVSDNSCR